MSSTSSEPSGPPSPLGATTLDDLTERLVAVRAWAGQPSYSELVRRIADVRARRGIPEHERTPGRVTVYDCFRVGRQRLDIELVVDIVTALGAGTHAHEWRQSHHGVVRGDDAARVVRVVGGLPAMTDHFVGREDEMAMLESASADVSVIVGMPGAGKTELAVRVGHRLATRYDRHLYVNLRGYHPDQPPADPSAVLDSLLRRLDVSPAELHLADLAQKTGLLSRAAGDLRLLLLLDNARDAAQILPLLPSGGSARVLITSRNTLEVPGATMVTLAPLSTEDSVRLLSRAAGPGAALDPATRRLAELCGNLPLHLRVVASHLADTPDWSIEDQVRRLESIPPEKSVRAALDASYRGLSASEQRMLRALPLHPGQGVSAQTAAVLAGTGVDEASELLDRLVAEHLLARDGQGLHQLHDVINAFAVGLGRALDPHSAQEAAFARLLAYYQRCTTLAVRHIRPDEGLSSIADLAEEDPLLKDPESAQAWLRLECENVVATALAADRVGLPDRVADLSTALQPWLEADVRFAELELLFSAVAASGTSARRREGARNLGRVYDLTGQLDKALEWSREAAKGEGQGDVAALNQLGNVLVRVARLDEAAETFDAALAVAVRTGNTFREGRLLGNLGSVNRLRGEHELSEDQFTRAIDTSRTLGDLENVSIVSTNQSDLFLAQGRLDEAIASLQVSIDLDERLGLRHPALGNQIRMALLVSTRGENSAALQMLDETVEAAGGLDAPIYLAEALNRRAVISLRIGDPTSARADLERARQIGVETGSAWVIVDATNGLGEVALHDGDHSTASELFETALTAAEEIGAAEEVDRARIGLAATERRIG